jgi:type IV pilus assembly protein PilX
MITTDRTGGFPGRQQGATLVIALLILVLIMMIGITAISTSNTQYKLAGNLQFEDGATNNAETAVTTAENWLVNPAVKNWNDDGFKLTGTAKPELIPFDPATPRPANRDATLLAMDWTDNNKSLSVAGNTQRYVIEKLSQGNRLAGSDVGVGGRASAGCNLVNTYLITGRGTGGRGAVKFVQSYFSVLSCI